MFVGGVRIRAFLGALNEVMCIMASLAKIPIKRLFSRSVSIIRTCA